MSLSNFIPYEIISALGWTIVHSLWHGIVVAILLSILLVFLSKSSAKIRSYVSYAALINIVAASIKTFSNYYEIKADQKENVKTLEQFILNESEVNSSEITTQNLFAEFKNTSTFVIESLGSFFQNNLNMIVSIWVVGILFFFIRLLGGFVYTQRIKHYKTFEVNEIWRERLQNLADEMQIQKKVQLVESALIKLPMVIGYFKPVVLMPLSTLTGLPQNQIEAILAHELAHIKREDYFLNIVQSMIEILFFFNPAVWWISSTIRKEREYSCDELAIEVCGDSLILANALIAIQQKLNSKPAFALAALGNENSLILRIKKMLNKNNNKLLYPKKLAVIVFMIISLGLITAAACSSNIDNLNNNELNNTLSATQNENINFAAIASPAEPAKPLPPADDEAKRKTFSFYEHENGDEVHWKVVTKDGEIVELYKDGEKLSDEEMSENEDYINDKLAEIEEGLEEIDEIDFDELHESLKNLKFNFKFDFDDESFTASMKQLKEGLKHLKDHKFNFEFDFDDDWDFDSESFREELKESLKELDHMNFEFDFDKEEFKEGMREFRDNMKDFKVDMKEFKANMKDFDVDMSELKNEMKELKVELKKLDGFLDETKSELISDGYVDEDAEDYDMELHEDEMIVNGKKLPDDLHKKYLDIYEKHFDKKLEDRVRVR